MAADSNQTVMFNLDMPKTTVRNAIPKVGFKVLGIDKAAGKDKSVIQQLRFDAGKADPKLNKQSEIQREAYRLIARNNVFIDEVCHIGEQHMEFARELYADKIDRLINPPVELKLFMMRNKDWEKL